MMGDSWRTEEEGVGMPDGLAAMLRGLDDTGEGVTGSVDLAVLDGARRVGRRRRVTRRVVRGGAVAAVVGLMSAGVWMMGGGSGGGPDRVAGDVNADGAVDMLDALVLAIEVEGGQGKDVDGDGVVGGQDVEWVARAAVSLGDGRDGVAATTLGVAR